MAGKKQKGAELKAWARRPWPTTGDRDLNETYAAVGALLSEWERYEGILSLLFSAFVAGAETTAARKAYNSVRTFEGRRQMLQAASQSHFDTFPDDELQAQSKAIDKAAHCFSERRNDVAHGAVDHFQPLPWVPMVIRDPTYCLYPSYANFKQRTPNDAPLYCYTSIELDYFRQQFFALKNPVAELAGALIQQARARALKIKGRVLYRERE